MKKVCYLVTISSTIKSFFLPQIKALANNNIKVTIIANDTCNIKEYLDENIEFIQVNIPRGVYFFKMLFTTIKLIKIFRIKNFDYIQYSTPNAAACASIASRFVKCKIRNYHVMGFRYLSEKGIKRFVLKFIEKISCTLSTHIECVSQSNLELGFSEKMFNYEKADVIWNGSTGGVDLERFNAKNRVAYREEIRKKLNINMNEFVFGFVGRITKDKGVNELLEAFYKLSDSTLLIIGEEEGKQTLNAELYEASIYNENIIYTGSVDDIEKYYAALDFLVLPSYREGFGNVIIEAAAMGTPAIVSNIPGPIDAILENETALVVEPCNSVDLYNKMINAKSIDNKKFGDNAIKYAKDCFDSKILCDKIIRKKIFALDNMEDFKNKKKTKKIASKKSTL